MAMIGAALSVVGTVFGVMGQMKEAKAMEKAEEARKKQMGLETARRQREAIRQATVARAEATSNAYNQGAGESSALQGGIAQVQGTQARNLQASAQDYQLGRVVFQQNAKIAKARGIQAIGMGISSIGGIVSDTSSQFARQTS